MKSKILVYTFRTFPYLEQLQGQFPQVHIFSKLKADLENFKQTILDENPDHIIGVAKSHSEISYFEPLTINQFHKNKRVIKDASEHYRLFIPSHLENPFSKSLRPSSTFCNYSMFNISHFLNQNHLDIPFSFIHTGKTGIGKITTVLDMGL